MTSRHALVGSCPTPECGFDGGDVPIDVGRNRVEDWWEWVCPECETTHAFDPHDDNDRHELRADEP